jgi:hypothetical protein
MPDSRRRIAAAARIIESNPDRFAATERFRSMWGLSADQARQLYEDAARSRRPRRWRTRLHGIVLAITALFAAAVIIELSGVATFDGILGLVFWTAMLLVTVPTLVVMAADQKRVTLAGRQRPPVWPMYMLLILAFSMFIGAVFSVVESSDDRKPPPDSDLVWTPEEAQLTGPNTVLFSGEITNNSRKWEIVEPKLDLEIYDDMQQWYRVPDLELADSPIGPGHTYRYSQSVELRPGYDSHREDLTWRWRKVE